MKLWTKGRFRSFRVAKLYIRGYAGGSMSEDSRANLEICWLKAEKASTEKEQRAWLEMAEAWRLLIAIGDAPSASEHRFNIEHSSHLTDRFTNIGGPRQQVIRQLRTHLSKFCGLITVIAGTLSESSYITLARRSLTVSQKRFELFLESVDELLHRRRA